MLEIQQAREAEIRDLLDIQDVIAALFALEEVL